MSTWFDNLPDNVQPHQNHKKVQLGIKFCKTGLVISEMRNEKTWDKIT